MCGEGHLHLTVLGVTRCEKTGSVDKKLCQVLRFRILDFRRIPPVSGRLVNITKEIRDITTDKKLAKTFFISPGELRPRGAGPPRPCFGHVWSVPGPLSVTLCFVPHASGQRLLLRGVLLLLLHRARAVWQTRPAGGLRGRPAARQSPGQAALLAQPLAPLLPQEQEGRVSRDGDTRGGSVGLRDGKGAAWVAPWSLSRPRQPCTARRWELNPNYCAQVRQTPPYDRGHRLLDLIDMTVLDFLMGEPCPTRFSPHTLSPLLEAAGL